jgi:hypothetical protein
MARCNSCNGVITKSDLKCFVCGEKVAERSAFSLSRWWNKPAEVKRATAKLSGARPGLAQKQAMQRVLNSRSF